MMGKGCERMGWIGSGRRSVGGCRAEAFLAVDAMLNCSASCSKPVLYVSSRQTGIAVYPAYSVQHMACVAYMYVSIHVLSHPCVHLPQVASRRGGSEPPWQNTVAAARALLAQSNLTSDALLCGLGFGGSCSSR